MLYAFLIHHIFLYLTTRDRSYLPFCALLAVFTVSSPMSDGAAEFVGAVQYWGGGGRFLTTGGSNIFIASLLLTASYFDMKNTMRRTYYVLLALVATFAVLSVAQIHTALGRKLGPFILALTGLVSFFEIGIGITMWLRGYKPAALWVAAWMSFETGSVVFVASLLGMLPRNIFTCYAPHWSILGLTILLSLGLGVRVRWLMNDHEEALNDVERFSRKMNEMRNLVRILCHDMATPLTVILTKAEKGLAEVQDPLTREAWQAVMQAAKLEREIMEHVARLESFDRTYSEDTIKSISVEEALKQTVYVFETAIRNKNLSIHTKVHGSSDLTIETDPLILTQTLLGNLVSNAVKFTRRGGQIHLSAHDEGEYLRFRVADNGIGLGEMSSAKGVISKPGSARLGTEGETGSGLGLSLVRSYIEKFGGRLELSSLPGTEAVARGTVVEMWLPRKFHEKSHEPVRLKGLRRQLA
jgi:signal transduction histidine kinase